MKKILTPLLATLLLTLWLPVSAPAADGMPAWTNLFTSPGNGYDSATALAVDGSGNVYVTGYRTPAFGSYSDYYATIKYSTAGVVLWIKRFPGAGSDYTTLAVDGNGNVYVTRSSYGSGYDSHYATIKYSTAGVALWTNLFNGAGNGQDSATALAVDGSGNVYVTGYTTDSEGNYNYATIKYSTAGVALWTNIFNGEAYGDSSATALAVDGSSNVYVTGYTTDSGGFWNSATIKYSTMGVALWTNLFKGEAYSDSSATALAVDSSGNVYVTGNSYVSGSDYDYATIKYSTAGAALWTNLFNGPGNGYDSATSLAVDGSGNVYVTGSSYVSGSGNDYATIKYSGAITDSNAIPILGISTYGGNQPILFWPASGNNYVLQMCTNLATGNWVTVSNYTPMIGALVTNAPVGAAFFRLQ